MTQIAGPATKTIAYRILAALEGAPNGMLTNAQLLQLLTFATRTHNKLLIHAAPLLAGRLVRKFPDGLEILPNGRCYLQQNYCAPVFAALPDLRPVQAGSMALARTVPKFKPLSMSRMLRGKPQRDGMDDYRSVPSLIGVKRVMLGDAK